jgi:hypothetical protein
VSVSALDSCEEDSVDGRGTLDSGQDSSSISDSNSVTRFPFSSPRTGAECKVRMSILEQHSASEFS